MVQSAWQSPSTRDVESRIAALQVSVQYRDRFDGRQNKRFDLLTLRSCHALLASTAICGGIVPLGVPLFHQLRKHAEGSAAVKASCHRNVTLESELRRLGLDDAAISEVMALNDYSAVRRPKAVLSYNGQ